MIVYLYTDVVASLDCFNKLPKTGWLKRNLFSQSSGGQTSDVKVSSGPYSLWRLRGTCFSRLFPAPDVCWPPLAFQGWKPHCSSFCWFSHGHRPSALVPVSHYTDTQLRMKICLNPVWHHLNSICRESISK